MTISSDSKPFSPSGTRLSETRLGSTPSAASSADSTDAKPPAGSCSSCWTLSLRSETTSKNSVGALPINGTSSLRKSSCWVCERYSTAMSSIPTICVKLKFCKSVSDGRFVLTLIASTSDKSGTSRVIDGVSPTAAESSPITPDTSVMSSATRFASPVTSNVANVSGVSICAKISSKVSRLSVASDNVKFKSAFNSATASATSISTKPNCAAASKSSTAMPRSPLSVKLSRKNEPSLRSMPKITSNVPPAVNKAVPSTLALTIGSSPAPSAKSIRSSKKS